MPDYKTTPLKELFPDKAQAEEGVPPAISTPSPAVIAISATPAAVAISVISRTAIAVVIHAVATRAVVIRAPVRSPSAAIRSPCAAVRASTGPHPSAGQAAPTEARSRTVSGNK